MKNSLKTYSMNNLIKFKKLHPSAKIPTMSTLYSGAYDIYCTEVEEMTPFKFRCKTGLALEIPQGYRIMCIPRSSITNSHWVLQNSIGLIDSDYRGELSFVFTKIHEPIRVWTGIPYSPGERIGQIYLDKIMYMTFQEHDELSETARGSGGFGSTGK